MFSEVENLQKRLLTIIALFILLVQPVLVGLGTPGKFELISEQAIPAQDPGFRIDPVDLTDHVPIEIDETADFVSQGWPGTGSESDPYVISGLNITYDIDVPLIRVYNIKSHFVIQDSYFGQLSNDYAVHFENVTNAALEFVTIDSALEGISFKNVTDSTVSSIYVDVDGTDGILVSNSHNIEIESNLLTGGRLYVSQSSGANAHHNEFSMMTVSGARIHESNGTLFHDNKVANTGSVGLDVYNSSFCEIYSNTFRETGDDSIYLRLSEYVSVSDNDIIEFTDAGIDFVSHEGISIVGNILRSGDGFPIRSSGSENGIISNNEMVNNPDYSIIYFSGGLANFTIADNYMEDLWIGLYLAGGSNVSVLRNTIINAGSYSMYINGISDTNIINNTCSFSPSTALYLVASPRAHISGNSIESAASYGIYVNRPNCTITGNRINDCSAGIRALTNAENVYISDNYIQDVDAGIVVYDENATVDANTIKETGTGIVILTGAEEAQITANTIESTSAGIITRDANASVVGNDISSIVYGILIEDATSPEIEDNVIISSQFGIFVDSTIQATFEGNNMTDCGLYFVYGQPKANLNHSFINNHVNDKELFYALNQSGLNLDGSEYGEVILVNCSDITLDGGEFTWSTSAIQVYYSDRVDISNVSIVDQLYPILVYESINMTLLESVIEGRSYDSAILLNYANGFTLDNVVLRNLDDNGIEIGYSSPFEIRASYFENIADSAFLCYESGNGLIDGNTFSNATYGVRIQGTVSTKINDNHFRWNDYAIYSDIESDYNNATFNNIHDNQYGIRMDDSYSWYIYNNTIRWNDYGLYITVTDDNQWIYNNTFALNSVYNGYDDGADDWDDRVDGGNYWDDYGGTGVYNIPGGSSVDHFPMVYMVTEPIINNPIDVWYAEGSEGNFIVWLPFDDSLRDWVVKIDGTIWATGVWNFQNINVSIDGLGYGTYTVFVEVWDVNQNSVNDTVMVHVYDDTPPEINSPPNTIAFEDGSGQQLTWQVSDLNPTTFVAYINGEEYDTGTWSSGELNLNIDGLDTGEYVFKMVIQDVDGNTASDSIRVRVIDDNDAPEIDSPSDMVIVEGSSGSSIVWTPTDEYPDWYEIVSNDTIVREGDWGGGRIVLSLDGLDPGEYDFILTVYDGSGRTATDGVNVTVLPKGYTPQPPIDYFLLATIGAVAGGIIIAVAIGFYLRKKRST
jgi:parallel beta-helix repeat protein